MRHIFELFESGPTAGSIACTIAVTTFFSNTIPENIHVRAFQETVIGSGIIIVKVNLTFPDTINIRSCSGAIRPDERFDGFSWEQLCLIESGSIDMGSGGGPSRLDRRDL